MYCHPSGILDLGRRSANEKRCRYRPTVGAESAITDLNEEFSPDAF